MPDGSVVETVASTFVSERFFMASHIGRIPQEDTQDLNGVVRAQPPEANNGRIEVRWEGVESGRYRVDYWVDGESQPIPGIPEIEVVSSGPHPLLQNVDLR